MFSILEFNATTPEQVDKAVKDGLICPVSAAEWLAEYKPPVRRVSLYKFLKLVTISANYHHSVDREVDADPSSYLRHWWRTFLYEIKLSQEIKSTGC